MDDVTATTDIDDDLCEARFAEVDAVFEKVTFRPGAEIRWNGYSIEVFDPAVPDRDTGEPTPMAWDDQQLGDVLLNAVSRPGDVDIHTLVTTAAVTAAIRNDVHELCEFFYVDGVRVFDPHPLGKRYDDEPPVEVGVYFDDGTVLDSNAGTSRMLPLHPHLETTGIEDRLVQRTAEEMAERTTIAGEACFAVNDAWLTHTGTYHDRETGELAPFTWTTEVLCDWSTPIDGNPMAFLRSMCAVEFLRAAVASATHEVCEWFRVDGVRVFDPHPRAFSQHDLVRSVLRRTTDPFIPTLARS